MKIIYMNLRIIINMAFNGLEPPCHAYCYWGLNTGASILSFSDLCWDSDFVISRRVIGAHARARLGSGTTQN